MLPPYGNLLVCLLLCVCACATPEYLCTVCKGVQPSAGELPVLINRVEDIIASCRCLCVRSPLEGA